MANTKISALTSATTPLGGTEVLPIVQSSATVKVPVNDLTVRNIRANATTGILQVTGPTAASTRVMTVPDANFTAARTDAAQSFTGDQTLSTGNLVVSNGKGIDFSATPGTGTSELFADYEQGTWTPVITPATGALTTYTSGGNYTKVGNQLTVSMYFTISVAGTAAGACTVSGLPFSAINVAGSTLAGSAVCVEDSSSGFNYPVGINDNATTATIAAVPTYIVWAAGYRYNFSATYLVQ
jgi:hypothetical protein